MAKHTLTIEIDAPAIDTPSLTTQLKKLAPSGWTIRIVTPKELQENARARVMKSPDYETRVGFARRMLAENDPSSGLYYWAQAFLRTFVE